MARKSDYPRGEEEQATLREMIHEYRSHLDSRGPPRTKASTIPRERKPGGAKEKILLNQIVGGKFSLVCISHPISNLLREQKNTCSKNISFYSKHLVR